MMKDRSFFFRLNVIHVTHFGLIFVLLFSAIYLLNYHREKIQDLRDLKDVCEQNNSIINTYFNIVDSLSTSLPKKNELIESDWLSKNLNKIKSLKDQSIIVFNDKNKVLSYSFNTKLISNTELQFFEKNAVILNNFIDNTKIRYKKLHIGKQQFHSYTMKNESHKFYLCIFQSVESINSNYNQFIKIVMICFVLAFLLTILLVLLTNFKLTHPFNELILTIKNSNYLKSNISGMVNETEFIRKYIGILEDQVIFNEKKNEKISNSNSTLENDLKLAKKLQKNMLQSMSPIDTNHQKFELYAFSEPAFEIGGDLYDYFHVDDDHLVVTVADVAGKGIPASLYMIFTLTILRSISKPGLTVTDIIEKLNNKLIEENISDMFVTIFMGILNIKTGEFNYCNAAQSFPCLITVKGDVLELSESHGIPIGIYPDRSYQTSTITLNDGDQVFIYTDGLTDTVDENGLKFTVDVLKYNLMGTWFFSANQVVEKIIKSIEHFRGKTNPVDDLTILNLKYTPNEHN
jgi:serine phosphatase RsbU (regulator of sigma subunit)